MGADNLPAEDIGSRLYGPVEHTNDGGPLRFVAGGLDEGGENVARAQHVTQARLVVVAG